MSTIDPPSASFEEEKENIDTSSSITITKSSPLQQRSLEILPTTLQDVQDILSHRVAPHHATGGVASSTTKSVYEVLIDGLTQLCRVKPTGDDAILYLSDWLLANNPNQPLVSSQDDDDE